MRGRPATAVLAALTALAMLVGTTGCDVRLDEPRAAAAPADAAEQARQRAAQQSAALAEAAAVAATASSHTEVAALLEAVGQDVEVQLETLGGVWSDPGNLLRPVPRTPSPALVLDLLTESAATSAEAAVDLDGGPDGELATALATISVVRQLRATALASLLDQEAPPADDPTLPAALDPATAVGLIQTTDALGWVWEITAARATGEARADAVEQALAWRADAETLAGLAGVAGTDDDPRTVTYDLDVTDPTAVVAELEATLLPCWLQQLPRAGTDLGAVIEQAYAAGLQAGLAAPGAAMPVLPGFTTG